MSPAELDAFLGTAHTCRVATASPDGPHNTPLWFAWDGTTLWLYSIVKSQRFTDLQRDPRVAVVIDAGEEYVELRGVEITGRATVVGPVARLGHEDDARLVVPEGLFASKYTAGVFLHDGRHAWLQVIPEKIASWDFRKAFPAP